MIAGPGHSPVWYRRRRVEGSTILKASPPYNQNQSSCYGSVARGWGTRAMIRLSLGPRDGGGKAHQPNTGGPAGKQNAGLCCLRMCPSSVSSLAQQGVAGRRNSRAAARNEAGKHRGGGEGGRATRQDLSRNPAGTPRPSPCSVLSGRSPGSS